ncbi:ribonuclease H-like domain-containing protein [Tanacetum coccineum]
MAPRNQGNKKRCTKKDVPVETPCQMPFGFGSRWDMSVYDWSIQAKEGLIHFALMPSPSQVPIKFQQVQTLRSYSKESDEDDSPVNDIFKIGEGFHAVPPPYTRNYMPSRPDLSFDGLEVRKTTTSVLKTKTSISKTSKDIVEKPKTVRPSAPIIEECDTDNDNDSVFRPKSDQTKPKFTKINFVKSGENVKSVNKENTHRQVEYPMKSQSPREKPVLNNKGRVTGQREIRPVWNNAQRVNHQNKLTHPHPKTNFVPTTVATKSGQVLVNAAKQSSPIVATSISTARPVNTASPKPKVNDALPITYSYFQAHSPVKKRINKRTAGNPQYTLQDQGIFDSGCSRHMTGNKSFLTDYQEIDGGFVAFRGSPKGGKITRKGKIRTGKLDFEDTECLVLSPDFKLLDESQVLLKVPRHNNMYTFDLKNVVPLGVLPELHNKMEFKNNDMNQFCGMKGIKREFSVANTPQQNGVSKRKNRTLIEEARTILADSLLPTIF